MDNETREMFQLLLQGMEKMEKRIDTRMDNLERGLKAEISDVRSEISDVRAEVKASEMRIMVKMENDITKRLDALVDGYKGNYERQEELALKVDEHDRRIERLETIAG